MRHYPLVGKAVSVEGHTTHSSLATVVIVAFRTGSLDLDWIPADAPVLVVHNDEPWPVLNHPGVVHLGDSTNIGFGRGVNSALPYVKTPRIILANPDTRLNRSHWDALATGTDQELVTVPLSDARGVLTSVVNAYPTPASLMVTALRLGRVAPRGTRARHFASQMLGRWGAEHARSLLHDGTAAHRWPLATHWPSAAVCSYPTGAVREVGGFDPGYFLYLEDADLALRLARAHPLLEVVLADVEPGIHEVGGSSGRSGRRRSDAEHARSASRYASGQTGICWWLASKFAARLARRRIRRS